MKTIGMLGGVSWESTALYYQWINESIQDRLGSLNSAQLLLHSFNYQELIDYKNQNDWDKLASIVSHAASNLEKAGAEGIVLCCNTLHKIASMIENSISVPFIHIAEAAGECLYKENITTVGLLGTRFTMEDGFYSQYLIEKYKINTITPTTPLMNKIDEIIYKELCVGKCSNESQKILLNAIEMLDKQGAEAILLGCTELGLMIHQDDYPLPIFDTTVLHARKIVEFALFESIT